MSDVILITGMHRSGTSLVSSLLQRAGIHIGEKLLGGNAANPRGYFEDVDFFEFQDQLLHQRGQTYLHVDRNFSFDPTTSEIEHAKQLIAGRSHRPVWGWKDPRTALFLDFWNQLLPNSRFLFVYRHPIEVLLSLLRRGEFDHHPSLISGLHAWHIYNANIAAFRERHPDRCLLVSIEGVVQQTARFAHLLQEKLELESHLDPAAFEQIYHVDELQKTPLSRELCAILTRVYPGLLELYQNLEVQADLSSEAVQTEPAASPQLSALACFTESQAEPISLPVQHSLLQMLLSTLAPELTERMLVRFNHSTKEAQQKIDQIWLQVLQLERSKEEQNQIIAEKTQLLMELASESERRSVEIESLEAELNSIYATHLGKVMRSYRSLKERWKKAA